jgi:ABC-type branched-subunit amino acid transport system ATPase component/ABC-type branched-subunit amino acid transport system permease subunit
VTAVAAAAGRTRGAVRGALADARRGWSPYATAGGALAVLAGLAPFLLGGAIADDTLATGAYEALAATGLALCVGLAGVPSLAQGAFVGTGAFAAAHLLRHTQAPAEVAALVGALAATALGVVIGFAVRSLDAVRVAVATWLLSWLVALALGALPWLSGGAQGLVVPTRRLLGFAPTPLVHYELGVVLTGLCALALVALRRGPFGLDLAAATQRRPAAAALGVPMERLRVIAFAASAFVGGLAGGLLVQLNIVADPTAYGPLLSFELLVAVLVGGAAVAFGPSAGVIVLGLIALAARGLGALAPLSGSRFEPMLEALLLLAVLTTGGSALVPATLDVLRRFGLSPKKPRRRVAHAAPPRRAAAALRARGLTKRFGAVTAADHVSFELAPGTVTALVGPNGSGKTTVLRLLAGAQAPDCGSVKLGARDLTLQPPSERVGAGVVRTLQARGTFDELTVLENVLVGVDRTRRRAGALRTVTSTPLYRAENDVARGRAVAALEAVGLEQKAEAQASSLSTSEQRLLELAAALATNPAVLLLDEPSAGAGDADLQRLARVISTLRDRGLAILLVEHNLRLVNETADTVVLLANGRVTATGSPEEIAASVAAREAYFGRDEPGGA